jgi:hypothetical protein
MIQHCFNLFIKLTKSLSTSVCLTSEEKEGTTKKVMPHVSGDT